MTTTIAIPLDIDDVAVHAVEYPDQETIRIGVESTIHGTRCRRCGRWITQPHGTDRTIELRHLPVFGRRTYIRFCPKRYRCPTCPKQPTTTQRLPWHARRGGHPQAYDHSLVRQVINSTVEDASQREQVGSQAVMGALRRHVATAVQWEAIDRLEVLGGDEIALKKGHKDFVTVVTGRVDGRTMVLGMLTDRTKATVTAFLQQIPERLRDQIVAICSDLYEGFLNAAAEVFGRERVVVDRFHVARQYRKVLETARKRELRRLKAQLSKAEYGRLKGVMWTLRKTPQALTQQEHEQLRFLFQQAPTLQAIYDECQALTDIFDTTGQTRAQARQAITQWMNRVKQTERPEWATFLTTLTTHWTSITNYFRNRHTSGFVEGLNNKLNVIKRRCYGLLNPQHLFQRISLDLAGHRGKIGF